MNRIDFIGDIHGHATKLTKLLQKLGYKKKNGTYSHPERKVLFIGDYIDRGPQIRETVQIVRDMVKARKAIALMGNHEYNALCFHYPAPIAIGAQGGHLRKHSIKNILQHHETIRQFKNDQAGYNDMLDWFLTLPLYYETQSFRAVHACWDKNHIAYLRKRFVKDKLNEKLIIQSAKKNTKFYDIIDETLKGKESRLPEGQSFSDKDGFERTKVRIRWWEDPKERPAKDMLMPVAGFKPPTNLRLKSNNSWVYPKTEKPVFFGHYWLKGKPKLFRGNVCCLDYSVAKGGLLAAYRFDGEQVLDKSKFVYV